MIDSLESVFDNKSDKCKRDFGAAVKGLHTKIGELTMVNSFLESVVKKSTTVNIKQ